VDRKTRDDMMRTVVGAVSALDRGDRAGFDTLLEEARETDPRAFVVVALGTLWQVSAELAKATGKDTAAVLSELAVLAEKGQAALDGDQPP
jgi:hypothetical protein